MNVLRGAMESTSFHSTAWRPLTPSARVAKTSARSRRTWRLSTTRVSPPVPGSTASSGTSGSETVLDRSSMSTISSHASASSYPPPAAVPLTAAIHTCPEWAVASSIELRVSFVNLQKLTLWACVDPASIWMLAPEQNTFSRPLVTTTARTSGVLEAQALHRVVELDVDAEVVRVELELVVVTQPTGRIDLHRERGDRSVDGETPVAVGVRAGAEVDQFRLDARTFYNFDRIRQ